MNALSYFPTTGQIRSCISLKDKLYMVADLFMLFLCYPFYHIKALRTIPLVLYKAMKDYRLRAGGIVFVMPGNCPPENAYINEGYEPEVRSIIENFRGGVFVDAGAGLGLYSLMAAKNGVEVIALEPDINFFVKLVEAAFLENGFANIRPLRRAAWCRADTVKLYNHPFARFSSSLKEGSIPSTFSNHFTEVPTVEIDSVIPEGSPVLLKLDVENSEPEAMVGALKTLLRKDVTVIFEALSPEALARSRQIIEPLGYSIMRLSKRDYLARRP